MPRHAQQLIFAAAILDGAFACVGGCAGCSSGSQGGAQNRAGAGGNEGVGGGAVVGGVGTAGTSGRPEDAGRGSDATGAGGLGLGGTNPAGDPRASLGGSAGTPPDAGPSSQSDARGGDTKGSPACPGLFCEDFERGAIDPAIWEIKVNGGQAPPDIVAQPGLVAHGRYAVHFRAAPNAVSYDFMITKQPPAALSGHHFGRAYFMITPTPPTNHTEYIYAGTTGFPQYKYLEVASAAPLAWQLTFVNLVPPGTGEDYHSGGKVPIAKWFCLEWEFNDTPDRAAVFVDGAASFSQDTFTFKAATTGLVGGFSAFGFGYYAWHPATYAFDVYYDDIVLDSKRVGCLP